MGFNLTTMRSINFTKISIQNFLSVGETPVEIKFSKGFNIITGINHDENNIKNGVGKTLVIDALYFAIFGTTLRDLSNKSYIVNRQVGKRCKVTLEFDAMSSAHDKKHFIVTRSIAPNALTVFKDGVDKTQSSIIETNKYVHEVLNANEAIFRNCLIMRANDQIPFMVKKSAEKKSFIESIFNLSVFSDMLKKVKEDLRGAKSNYDISNTEFNVITENKNKYEEEIKILTEEIARKTRESQAIIHNLQGEIEECQGQIQSLEDQKKAATDYSAQIQEQQGVKSKANTFYQQIIRNKYRSEANIQNYEGQIQRLDNSSNICPTCKREYDASHKEHIVEARKNLVQSIADERNSIAEFTKKETQLKEIIDKTDKILQDLGEKQGQIRYISDKIYDIKRIISSKQSQILAYNTNNETKSLDSFKELLKNAKENIKEKEILVKKFQKEINKLNVCEHILGEYGIRSYIVNKLLALLNHRIAYYLGKLKSTFKFTFNEVFEEEIKDSNGVLCSYGNCSGAEMKKIDLAISFSFIDILRNQQQLEYNLLFLDEILDSSLDTKSLEYVVEFLSNYVKENKIGLYLITHKSDVNLPDITDVITLVKENGFTTFPNS